MRSASTEIVQTFANHGDEGAGDTSAFRVHVARLGDRWWSVAGHVPPDVMRGGRRSTVQALVAVARMSTVLLLSAPCIAQVRWVNVGTDGGPVSRVLVSSESPDLVYAVTAGGALYGSSNGGDRWTEVGAALPGQATTVLSRGTTGEVLYAGTRVDGIHRTADGGLTWVPARAGLDAAEPGRFPEIRDIVAHPLHPQVAFAATSDGVFVTKNGAVSWTLTSLAGSVDSLTTGATASPQLYALRLGRLYRSADQAITWVPADTGLPSLSMMTADPVMPGTLYAGTSGASLYRSIDDGVTWASLATPQTFGTASMMDFSIIPSDPRTIVVILVGGGRVMRSSDGGTTWAQSEDQPPGSLSMIAADSSPSGRFYIATSTGVFRSVAGGTAWSAASRGLLATATRDLSPRIAKSQTVAAALTHSLGLLAVDLPAPWKDVPPLSHGTMGKVAFVPDNEASSGTLYADSGCSGVWRSSQPGGGWVPMSSGLSGSSVCIADILPRSEDPDSIFIATAAGVHYAHDGGAFVSRSLGLPKDSAASALVRSGGGTSGLMYVLSGNTIYRSADDALHWEPAGAGVPVGPGKRVLSLGAPTSASAVVYAGTSQDGVYRSTDAGASWTAAHAGLPRASVSGAFRDVTALLVVSESEVYAGLYRGGVYATFDGGVTWSVHGSEFPQAAGVHALARLGSGAIVAATTHGPYTTAPVVRTEGVVAYENFTEIDELAGPVCGFNPPLALTPKSECAVSFTAPATLVLDHVDMGLEAAPGTDLLITLRQDAAGLPGDALETMSVNAQSGVVRVSSTTKPHLQGGEKYWISVTSNQGVGNWLRSTRVVAGRAYYGSDGAWVLLPNAPTPALRVVGQFVEGVTGLSHSSWIAPGEGGSLSIAVNVTAPSVGWTATASAAWLSVSPATGVGNGTVVISALPATAKGSTAASPVIVAAAVEDGSGGIALEVSQPTGDGVRKATVTFAPVAPSSTFTRYLAEGATSSFFETRLALLNPAEVSTTATLTFVRSSGQPIVHVVGIPAKGRVTVLPKEIAGLENAEFSTSVEADQPLVVDRTMTWAGAAVYGSHAETGVSAPSTIWYLAEGATHSGFDLFYLLQNPTNQPTAVRIRYLLPSGAPLEKTYPLPGASRTNIWVNLEEFEGRGRALASTDVSAVIESLDGTPFIVERAMYRSSQTRTFNAGHESMGVTTPSTRWFLAEGATGDYFDMFVLIANPNSVDANVTVSYLLGDGSTYHRSLSAPASSRSGIWVDMEEFPGVPGRPLSDVAVSTTVTSTNGVPLIVERAMWWPGPSDSWQEAHNSAASTQAGTRWALAEGEVGGPGETETYILIANTSTFGGAAKVTLWFEDGGSDSRDYELLPNSRTNVPVKEDFANAAGRRFGAVIESKGTTPAQIVVERAMYSNAGGMRWAAGTNALATRLP